MCVFKGARPTVKGATAGTNSARGHGAVGEDLEDAAGTAHDGVSSGRAGGSKEAAGDGCRKRRAVPVDVRPQIVGLHEVAEAVAANLCAQWRAGASSRGREGKRGCVSRAAGEASGWPGVAWGWSSAQ